LIACITPSAASSMAAMPARQTAGAHDMPLTQPEAPVMVTSIEMPAHSGQREGPGT